MKKIVFTHCDFCVFRTNDENGVQKGCLLGKLDKFEEKTLTTDNYYKVKGLCVACRNQDWVSNIPEHQRDINEYKKRVYDENTVGIDYVILSSSSTELKHVEHTLKSVLSQKIKPNHIYLTTKTQFDLSFKQLQDVASKHKNVGVHLVVDNNYITTSVSKHCQSKFICFIYAGSILPVNYSVVINDMIFYDNYRPVLVEDDGSRSTLVFNVVFGIVGGDGKLQATDKIKQLAKWQEDDKAVYRYTQLEELWQKSNYYLA